jgi:hypothetical protein
VKSEYGGRGGSRTHGRVTPTPDFESGALNHSATLPHYRIDSVFSLIPLRRFAFSILMFCTVFIRRQAKQCKIIEPASKWQKTPVANLLRNAKSGASYARARVGGKLLWKSLKTDRMSVAQLRLGNFPADKGW